MCKVGKGTYAFRPTRKTQGVVMRKCIIANEQILPIAVIEIEVISTLRFIGIDDIIAVLWRLVIVFARHVNCFHIFDSAYRIWKIGRHISPYKSAVVDA